MKKIISLILVITLLSACSTLTSVSTEQISSNIKPGDIVRVHTKNGMQTEFKVTSINNQTIYGVNRQGIPINKIDRIEKRVVNEKTLGVVTAVFAGAVVAAVIIGLYLISRPWKLGSPKFSF